MILVRKKSSQKGKTEAFVGNTDDDDDVVDFEEDDEDSDMDTTDVTEDDEEGESRKGVNGTHIFQGLIFMGKERR